jgi:hypothetical protein
MIKVYNEIRAWFSHILSSPEIQSRMLNIQAERHQNLVDILSIQAERHQHLVDILSIQAERHQHLVDILSIQAESHQKLKEIVNKQGQRFLSLEDNLTQESQKLLQYIKNEVRGNDLTKLSHHFHRNVLPNDDSCVQKNIISTWRILGIGTLSHSDLATSGFRVFSQNDEDGIILRLFTHIGHTNRYVIEVGSNCSGSEVGIPENLSANLIVNHGWHGSIFEIDPIECERMTYFFARDHSTRHFHALSSGINTYYSPKIIPGSVSPQNINQILLSANNEPEPDLLVLDIDGGDYAVMESMKVVQPRVIVVEFEKRFRDQLSVVQFGRTDFSKRWQQSGSVSLQAWIKLLGDRGYMLCSIGTCGFNAFFVRKDVAAGKLLPLTATMAFDSHPIFNRMPSDFWLVPDETWTKI